MRTAGVPAIIAALGLPMTAESNESHADTPPLLLEAAYTGEVWRNFSGGARRDGTYLDNIDVIATLDAERAFGWRGTTFLVSGLYNNKPTLSDRIVGDIQTVSNIDTEGASRVYEAWVERAFEAGAIKLGLIDLNSELDVNETGALFVNSSHGIGPDFSQVGENGPSIFPITGLGTVMRWDYNDALQIRLGAFEGTVGDPTHPNRAATFDIEDDEGALLVGELTLRPTESNRSIVGVWRHTGRSTDFNDEELQRRTESLGVYALTEGKLLERGEGSLSGFLRVGFADGDVHQISRYVGAGLVWSGPLLASAESEEQLGLAVGNIANGQPYRHAQAELGSSFERHETAIELTYRVQALPWLALQPDLQYIINPGTNPTLDDAWVVGLRFEFSWSNEAG
ncbi:carbohydrate porin [Steroidobacter sp.]|uniref:carbohydrate porin n=1 Tax=Steroidobacter sp. TaxID=1978227 RepID=UPI001A469BB4|nr:carbohydrate porin [Steroidobacter sp.]MBL8270997.1 carbohydrate porin [Steroidobacter sp.]